MCSSLNADFSTLTYFLIKIVVVVYKSKTPNTISLNAPFTTPKDGDYCKQYTNFKLFLQ